MIPRVQIGGEAALRQGTGPDESRLYGSNRDAGFPGLQIILNRARHAIPRTASGRWASHPQAQYLKLALMGQSPQAYLCVCWSG